jgi:hypothetical protein
MIFNGVVLWILERDFCKSNKNWKLLSRLNRKLS